METDYVPNAVLCPYWNLVFTLDFFFQKYVNLMCDNLKPE